MGVNLGMAWYGLSCQEFMVNDCSLQLKQCVHTVLASGVNMHGTTLVPWIPGSYTA